MSETDFCSNSEKSDTLCQSESETDFNTADTGIDSFEPKSDDFEKSSEEKNASENGMVPEDNELEVDSGVILEIKETQVSKESAVLKTLEEKKWVIFELESWFFYLYIEKINSHCGTFIDLVWANQKVFSE